MERRRHKRVYTAIPMKYHVQVPESPAISWISSGVLQNISYSGLYFRSNDTPSLEEGQIRDFTFTSTKEHPNFPEATFIIAKGRVVRIDPREPDRQDMGVALEFVSVKFIDNLQGKSL
jgi:c-di-GMP-binding flagellar brake protein YcgR